jgi:hypothetical protein
MTLTIAEIENSYIPPIGHYSRAYWIPIHMLDEVRQAYTNRGISIKTRFRGPRIQSVGRDMPSNYCERYGNFSENSNYFRTYKRTYSQAMQDCLKEDATHFSVYFRY